MFVGKRLEEITKILERDRSIDVNTLSEQLGVTGKTIRQDLIKLEEMGILERVHGGAILKQNNDGVYPITQRKQRYIEEKMRIAQGALDFIQDGDIIIMDAGTTTLEIAKMLGDKKIIVITNDLVIAHELMHKENVTLHVTGGKLRRDEGSFTLLGRDTERTIRQYNANKCFIGLSALDLEQGLMVFASDESEVKKAMISVSKEVICLVDYSKFHKLAFISFASLEDIHAVITDKRITEEDQKYLRDKNIKLKVV